ncbi:expressed unknown protein [Seminavis robusta]|uniref:Uncharacterized protein n=1 Tax=Seminavis robusta TaxID=568900 RepID=A0A9N8H802_9STRA|nr:expressed unknown protein [Seminavis robusta]|eukprot:Sro80_g042951.1  (123) ;mRNA; f:19748-20116
MFLVTSLCATLADYATMVEFMKREFVTEAFVAYHHRHRYLQFCCLIHEDEEVNVRSWFPNYTVQEFDDDNIELDQPVTIQSCMLISMSNCDLIQTKNLKNTRLRICERLGLSIPAASTIVEP